MSDSDDLLKEICLLGKSQQYILLITAAILLSYLTTDIQKKELEATASGNSCQSANTTPINITSSTLVCISLIFFYNLTLSESDGSIKARRNNIASLLVLMAALIRLTNNFI